MKILSEGECASLIVGPKEIISIPSWANPHQGAYFAWQSWDVTNLISSGINSYMTYGRNEDDSRPLYSGYFKIPLTLLTVEDESYIYDFSKNTLGRAGTGLLAYKSQTSSLPSTVNNDPNNEFSATEYGKLKYDDQDFQSDVTATNNKRAAHRFVFNVSCCSNIANLDAINVTWNGKGYHVFCSIYSVSSDRSNSLWWPPVFYRKKSCQKLKFLNIVVSLP